MNKIGRFINRIVGIFLIVKTGNNTGTAADETKVDLNIITLDFFISC